MGDRLNEMRKVIIYTTLILILFIIGSWLNIFPIVVNTSQYTCEEGQFLQGDSFNLLEDLNDNYSIYISFSLDDLSSDKSLLSGKVYKCDDINVLKELKKGFNFIPKGADIATANSSIYILEDGKLIFSSSVVLDRDVFGLQSRCFGWVSNKSLIPIFSKFERVYYPLVFI